MLYHHVPDIDMSEIFTEKDTSQDNNTEIGTPDNQAKDDKINIDKKMLTKIMASVLRNKDKYDDSGRDLVNDKNQKSKTRRKDKVLIDVMYALGMCIDSLTQMIKDSKVECCNKHIIASGLAKENVIAMLSQQYDDLISPCGKKYRSEDMQRVMSFYPYNIRLTDFEGYFEPREINQNNDSDNEEQKQEPEFDIDLFKNPLPSQISILIPGYEEDKHIYLSIQILDQSMIIRILFEKTNDNDLIRFMLTEGNYEDEWLKLMIPIDQSPFTKTIIDWFKKQDIFLTTKIIMDVGNSWILMYYLNILKLLKNSSLLTCTNDSFNFTHLSNFDHTFDPDDWFLKPAEGKHVPTGDSDIEDQGNQIDHYIYHNHVVANVYRLDVGVTNYGKRQYLKWNICLNNQIKPSEAILLFSEKYADNMSIGEIVHDNDITRGLFDFLATQPIGQKTKYVIETLINLWD